MDRREESPWVQVFGRVAIHHSKRETREPTGASRLLVCILVAAGPSGASPDLIARSYWGRSRPDSWFVAIRVAASHLSAQLPAGWDVAADDDRFRLVPGDGFVDAWRVLDSVGTPIDPDSFAGWFSRGTPFAGVTGVDIVEAAAQQLTPIVDELAERLPDQQDPTNDQDPPSSDARRLHWLTDQTRAVVIVPPEQQRQISIAAAVDLASKAHVVVGDRRMLLPLGPFAVAFPLLRNEIDIAEERVVSYSAEQAFVVVSTTIGELSHERPQHILVANAPELDSVSLELLALLAERSEPSDFSLIICASPTDRDDRWLDFVDRAVAAGCELIESAPNSDVG